jgi:exodeoxyribonuclease-5
MAPKRGQGINADQPSNKRPRPASSTPVLWSPQQAAALDDIGHWYGHPARGQVYHLEGLAGVGKTELVVHLQDELDGYLQYASLTGKAASVLRSRGAGNATTLHSLLYGRPIVTDDDELIWKRREERPEADLIIADEASMIDGKLGRDLVATGCRVLVTGDHFQLPPVRGPAFFNRPDVSLTEIHRQAAGSQPLQMATAIRQGQRVITQPFDYDILCAADLVIVAMNRTRVAVNRILRRAQDIRCPEPVVGDRIVALRNNYNSGVLNGTLWTIEDVGYDAPHFYLDIIDDIGTRLSSVAHEDGFAYDKLDLQDREYANLDLFTFGYCLTAHKSQGSEWPLVAVIDETETPGFSYIRGNLPLSEFRQRWLYTSVTRARAEVVLMRGPKL